MKAGEFFVELGIDADSKTLNEFIKSLGEIKISTIQNIASFAALANELINLGTEATNAAIGFQMFQNQTGLSSQELQKWQIVAQQANVSTEAVASSVASLQRNLAEVRLGRGNISPFQMLGISASGNAFQVLEQLRSKMGRYDPATMTNLAGQMGITPEMINVLKLSDAEFSKLSKTVRGLTTDQQEQLLKMKQTVVQVGMAFKYAGYDIVTHFISGMEMLKKSLVDINFNMPVLIASVGLLMTALFPLQSLLVGLLLILDDIAVYASGGNSVFGLLEKKLGAPGTDTGPVGKAGQWQLDHFPDWLTNFITSAGSAMAGATPPSNNKTVTNHINVTVHGNGSAHDTGKAVVQEITNAQSQLNNQGH